ncbi:hypothetical protein GO755_33600 [Spirosoma sp. HMF4905]|uniref:2TM domain-containing protein n=1 Tax=Spirosoma arboris TaxID=2682092 RepID=A0A7K1SMI6_9BACT|nr:hypothetical protein [Spirosoma arboris]MVM35011.1 hypothetical protein [Spirosoma arboris]
MTRSDYPNESESYDPELDPPRKLPVNPKVRLSAVLIVMFLFLALFKLVDGLALSWWWISLPLWLIPIGWGRNYLIAPFRRALHVMKK